MLSIQDFKKMDVELELILGQVKELQRYADEVMEVRSGLLRHKEVLNSAWMSTEIEGINEAMDEMKRHMERMVEEIGSIGYDMLKAYEEME